MRAAKPTPFSSGHACAMPPARVAVNAQCVRARKNAAARGLLVMGPVISEFRCELAHGSVWRTMLGGML